MEDESIEHPERDVSDHDADAEDRVGSTEALLPVTLRQVVEATQLSSGAANPWNIGGRQVKRIVVVAAVTEEHSKLETHTAWYKLIDGTNGKPVMAFRYVEDACVPVLPLPPRDGVMLLPEHRYVRVMGTLSAMRGGGTSIRVESFHVVEDYHEVYTHKLQVMTAALVHQRGPPPVAVLQSLSNAVKYPSVQEPPQLGDNPTSTQRPPPQSQLPKTSPETPLKSAFNAQPAPSFSHSSYGNEASTSEHGANAFKSRTSPQPPSSQRPSTPPRADKGKQRERADRRFSMEDPLSDLTPTQRTILLKIMDGTAANPTVGLNIVQLAISLKTEEGIEDTHVIASTVDILLEKGHISTDAEGMMYKAISKQTTNMYPMDID